jgi:hypothetical protein
VKQNRERGQERRERIEKEDRRERENRERGQERRERQNSETE